jgi:hypothetical protein
METDKSSHRTQIIVAVIGVIGVIAAAAIARWGLPGGGDSTPSAPSRPSTQSEPSSRPASAISGRWVDNWGSQFAVTQSGSRFTYTGSGSACRGPFTSQGAVTISGRTFEHSYRTAYSTGTCTGTISADGSRSTSDCTDSVCGPFRSVSERQ